MEKLGFYSYEENDESSDNGPRTAAVLTFSGNTNDSFVKELTQNSLDARIDRGGKLKIKVSYLSIFKTQIPNFEQFVIILNQMENYWNNKSAQYKKFFETAKSSINGDKVNVLVFEDYLTKGLEGDDDIGTFKNCVNDENVSGKEYSDSLGNHGIGKNSVFGYSSIHTVFYSSFNTNKECKFKGVSKLGNYMDENNKKKQERVYYGAVKEKSIKLISNEEMIPDLFKRNQPGLSQFVIGAEVKDDWANNVKKAFISNFWFLFEADKLEVNIDNIVLNKMNYVEEANLLFNNQVNRENPLPYIKAFKEKQIYESKEISKIGKIHFYAMEAEVGDSFPNRIVFVRDGMKIKLDTLGLNGLPVNIAGVMYCDNIKGNSILGAMEPHAHDKFLPELVAAKQVDNVSVEEAKMILKEIDDFKRSVLTKLRDKYLVEGNSVDIVDDLFSAILGSGKGNGAGKTIESKEETFNRRTYKLDFDGIFSSNSRNSVIDNLSDINLVDGVGSGLGVGKGGSGVHQNKKTDNKYKGGGGGSDASKKSVKGKIQKNLSSRFFISESNEGFNRYKMILRSNEDFEAFNLIFSQHGDSGIKDSEMSSILISVHEDEKNIPFDVVKNDKNQIIGYRIKGLSVKSGEPSIYELEMEEKTTSALQIIEFI